MSDREEIVLVVKEERRSGSANHRDGYFVSLTLQGHVKHVDWWNEYIAGLRARGFRPDLPNDLKAEIIAALREEVRTCEARLANRDQEISMLRHQLRLARGEVGSGEQPR